MTVFPAALALKILFVAARRRWPSSAPVRRMSGDGGRAPGADAQRRRVCATGRTSRATASEPRARGAVRATRASCSWAIRSPTCGSSRASAASFPASPTSIAASAARPRRRCSSASGPTSSISSRRSVVILAGTNDIAGNTGPMTDEEIEGNLESMAELAKAHGIKVVLASITPTGAYHTRRTALPQTTHAADVAHQGDQRTG